MTVSEKVRKLMETLSMRQADLVISSGISQPVISRFLSEETTNLTLDHLIKIARALGVSVDYLVTDRETMTSTETILHNAEAEYIFQVFQLLKPGRRRSLREFAALQYKQQTGEEKRF